MSATDFPRKIARAHHDVRPEDQDGIAEGEQLYPGNAGDQASQAGFITQPPEDSAPRPALTMQCLAHLIARVEAARPVMHCHPTDYPLLADALARQGHERAVDLRRNELVPAGRMYVVSPKASAFNMSGPAVQG